MMIRLGLQFQSPFDALDPVVQPIHAYTDLRVTFIKVRHVPT